MEMETSGPKDRWKSETDQIEEEKTHLSIGWVGRRRDVWDERGGISEAVRGREEFFNGEERWSVRGKENVRYIV